MTQLIMPATYYERHPDDPERFQLPEIVRTYSVSPSQFGIGADLAPNSITAYEVSDPYLEQIPEGRLDEIRAQETLANSYARLRRVRGLWDRNPGTAYQDSNGDVRQKSRLEWGDPESRNRFFGDGADGLGDEALRAWLTLVPSAAALAYLSDPFNTTAIRNRRGNSYAATEATCEWLAACTDAADIRGRAAGLAEEVREYVTWRTFQYPGEPLTMMSVACGTALPTMQAVMRANAPNATLLLVDKDKRSMSLTSQLAQEIGFSGTLQSKNHDIFDRDVMRKLRQELTNDADRRPHLVDAMGIFEYTGEELRPPGDTSDSLLYDPAGFLRACYDLVRPGGRLIFGQMRDDRPNADFTMGVVCWPYVCMRNPKRLMEIIQKAGINPRWVNLSLTPHGVYTIASIDKPARGLPEQAPFAEHDAHSPAPDRRSPVPAALQMARRALRVALSV
ncbi:MAG TPA: hypothetical protein VJ836_01755 [Candidatus Saccharimonadales bacterium]|nr:hypothetical protein [Candidatus Saccharimonadales bacterium]